MVRTLGASGDGRRTHDRDALPASTAVRAPRGGPGISRGTAHGDGRWGNMSDRSDPTHAIWQKVLAALTADDRITPQLHEIGRAHV